MTVAVALADPDVAVMVAVPSATAVTSPAAETAATEASDVVHAMVGFEMIFPAASVTVAMRVAVSPSDWKAKEFGDSSTTAAT